MEVDGTKVARARRQIALHVCQLGPGGKDVFRRWLDFVQVKGADIRKDELLFASEDEGSKRTSDILSKVLDKAFCTWSGEDKSISANLRGAYTAYSLRHAAAVRMIQGAIDMDFIRGNFVIALKSLRPWVINYRR
jgi:hypothetical protein